MLRENRIRRATAAWRCSAIVLALGGFAHAAALGSVDVTGWGLVIGQGVLSPAVNLRFALSDAGGSPCWASSPPSCYVLLDQVLTPADIGRTFAITAATNPDFQGIASSLTNGVDGEWSFSEFPSPGGAVGTPVSGMFPSGGGPDFFGDAVHEVDLTINNLVFDQVTLPTGLTTWGVFTEVHPNVTISVQGDAVPEPTQWLLLGSGLTFLWTFAKYR